MLATPQQAMLIALAALVLILALFVSFYLSKKRNLRLISSETKLELPSEDRAIFVDLSPKSADIVELAVEVWRMNNRLIKIEGLTEAQQRGFDSSLQKFVKFLDRYDVKIIDHTGEKYNEGMNVDVLSFESDSSLKTSMIKETIEPSVTCKGHIIKKGKIIVVNN
jgi:hypothetical protein